jgi:hypothetical protein
MNFEGQVTLKKKKKKKTRVSSVDFQKKKKRIRENLDGIELEVVISFKSSNWPS